MSVNSGHCVIITAALSCYLPRGSTAFLRYGNFWKLEAIKSCFNIDPDQTFVPFHRSTVLPSICNVIFARIKEPAYANRAVGWFTDAWEVHVANIWKNALQFRQNRLFLNLCENVDWWEIAASTAWWFVLVIAKVTKWYLQFLIYLNVIGHLRTEILRLFPLLSPQIKLQEMRWKHTFFIKLDWYSRSLQSEFFKRVIEN